MKAAFLGAKFPFAPGAAALAAASGAAIFPVASIREGGGYRVIIGPDLGEAGRGRDDLIQAFATWCEPHVEAHPEQFAGWLQI